MSEAAQTEAANATAAAKLIAKYLGQAEWDLAHQVVTSFRRSRGGDDAKLAELDPVVMCVLVHLEKAFLARDHSPKEADVERQRAHAVLIDFWTRLEEQRPLEPEDVWQLSLAEIGLETRIINLLEKHLLIETVADLLEVSRGRLLAVPMMSTKNLAVIVERLTSLRPLLLAEVNHARLSNDVSLDWNQQIRFWQWPAQTA